MFNAWQQHFKLFSFLTSSKSALRFQNRVGVRMEDLCARTFTSDGWKSTTPGPLPPEASAVEICV